MKEKTRRMSKKLGILAFAFVAIISALTLIVGLGTKAFKSKTITQPTLEGVGDEPGHNKTLKDNGDGTYTLSLDVTGDADTTIETPRANIIVMVDTSSSMTRYRANGGNSGPRRADATEKVIYDLTDSLFAYQDTNDPTNIQMALMTFNASGSTVQGWTSNPDQIKGRLSATGNYNTARLSYAQGTNYESAFRSVLTMLNSADKDNTFVIFLTDGEPSQYVGSTGWPGAAVCFGPSQDEAYRINMYDTATHTDPNSANYSNNSNTTLFGIYAYGDETDYLDDVIYYAYHGEKRTPENGETQATDGYYRASDTASLNSAISDIFNKIIETLGVTAVQIADGTTDQVQTSTGEMSHLLEVNTNSFQYWLSIPLVNNKFTRIDPDSGDTIEYTVSDSGNGKVTVTWTGHSVQLDGSINAGTLKYEWKESNDLYPKTPPTATYNNSKVDWDLSSVGTLLNGVTYTVTFEVYPSQETNDIIADLKNGYLEYDDNDPSIPNLDANLKQYIKKSGSDYTLETNTGATLSWKDTREDAPYPQHSDTYEPPVPVKTKPDQINMLKQWENAYDAKQVSEISIGVNKDGVNYTTVNLKDPEWFEGPINIAAGLMRVYYDEDGNITGTEILTSGHDFTFEELGEDRYNWEMIAQTIRPMSVNGEIRELILVNDQVQNIYTLAANPIAVPAVPDAIKNNTSLMYYQDSTGTFYRLESGSNKVYYEVILANDGTGEEDNQIPTIKAYNYRRSNLNVTKEVDGDSANPDDLFEFDITVNDPGFSEGEDYWFSVYKGGYVDLDDRLTGAGTTWIKDTEDGIYYHGTSGTINVKLKAGENLRVINLTTQATFDVVEKDPTVSNYSYSKGEFEAWYGKNETLKEITEEEYLDYEIIDTSREVKGSITVTNSSFYVTMTNTYELVNVEIEKEWDDNNNQDGIRPDSVVVNVLADGEAATYTSTECPAEEGGEAPATCVLPVGDITLDSSNQWKYTVEGLPRYNANGEITYTVTEQAIETPEGHATGYTTTIEDLREVDEQTGEITTEGKFIYKVVNTHTPEETEASVLKVWDDEDDRDGIRPTSITVNLLADGQAAQKISTTCTAAEGEQAPATCLVAVGDITLDEDNNWTQSVTRLPKYADGVEIEYTWTEGTVPTDYTLQDPSVNGIVTTLTNTHTPAIVSRTVAKVWEDEENQDGKRPESITVNLTANGSPAKAYTTCAENDDTCTVTLAAVGAVTLSEDNDWTVTVDNLPQYEDGEEITYEWTEDQTGLPEGYTLTDTDVKGIVTTFENSYEPEEISVSVTKVWEDNSNQDGIRGDVTFVLTGSTTDTEHPYSQTYEKTLTLEEQASGLEYVWQNLPVYDHGNKITYSLEETAYPDGYVAEVTKGNTDYVFIVTNTHTPETTEATVKKVWDDTNNQDGIRPTSLEVTLSNGDTVTLNEANGWEGTITGLPKYENQGTEIIYTWTEAAIETPEGHATGYVLSDTAKEGTVTTLTNTHTPETTEATVKKVWDDTNNQDGIRPETLTVTLSDGQSVTLSETNNWEASITDLPKYAAGVEIVYTWTEATIATPEGHESGYVLSDTAKEGTVTTLTNTHTPELTEATVKKVWDDADNQDGKRPETLTVTLSDGQSVTLSEENGWEATIDELPKYANGSEIVYTWTEGELPEGYTMTSNEAVGTITTITNAYSPEETYATVKKVWDDANDQDGIRPTSLTVTLSDGQSVTLNAANGWEGTITGLPKYADGVEIEYTWAEATIEVPEGHATGYELTGTSKDGLVTTLTNTHTPETTEATVKKVWNDADDQDGIRPTSIEVTLSDGQSVTLNDDNDWEATIDELPKYANGQEITYTWTEATIEVPEGHATGYELTGNATNGTVTTLTNTHTPELTEATVKKVWDDEDDQDGIRPTSIEVTLSDGQSVTLNDDNDWEDTITELPKYANGQEITYTWTEATIETPEGHATGYELTGNSKEGTVTTLTNTHTPELTEATIIKLWDDADNQDGVRPEYLEVTLSNYKDTVRLDDTNNWTTTIENLPKYADGVEIDYTWTEDEEGLPEGYSLTGNSKEGTVTTLTNSRTPEETEATIIKVWDDNDDQDGKRPETLTVTLTNYEPEEPIVLSEGNNWTTTIENLPKYANGQEIEYTWTEGELPEGYELTGDSKEGTVTTLTNSYSPEETQATIKKVWDDADNQDGVRPETLTVTLTNYEPEEPIVLSEDNDWTVTITGLPKYEDHGAPIVYEWSEDENGLPEGYGLTDTSVNGTITTLTNSRTPEETEASVVKVWDDADNQDGVRPKTLTVTLSNGTEVTLNEENGWTAKVEKLPKYANGVEIEYTWTEDEEGLPDGYSLTDTSVNGTVTTLTNSRTPEETQATVAKVWEDKDNQDGKRPESLTVTLSDGQSVTLSEDNDWTATITGLPKYANGQEIEYTWTEGTLPEGYELTSNTTKGTITTLENTYKPEEVDVSVLKVWDDNDDQDGIRGDITFVLTGSTNDTAHPYSKTYEKTLTKEEQASGLEYVWSKLPVYDNGNKITYSLEETAYPDGYTPEVTSNGTAYSFKVTNTHTPEETEATVKKVWDDADDQDGIRPETLTVTLSDGQSVSLNEANGWTATVEHLPKYENHGTEIVYTWTEDETGLPEGYDLTDTSVEGTITTFTNSYTPEETEATVKKVWDDEDDQDGVRPETLTVTLSDGTEVTLDETNGWTATVEHLPKYENHGTEIVYTWTEGELPEGYELTDTSVDGTITTLTNSYSPEETEATVKKVWDDADDQDGVRPETLTVTLSDGQSVTLNAENKWTATITGLPKYENHGTEIVYTWTEDEEGLPEGYSLTDTSVDGTITTLTNSRPTEETQATVTKVWEDDENRDGIRPETLTVTLSDGQSVSLSEDNDWTATITGLPRYANGEEIEYTWTEGALPEGYTMTSNKTEGTITTIKNNHIPERIKVEATKAWDDADDQDGIRPESILITLVADGEDTVSKEANADNNWTVTFENLNKYLKGKEIVYSVKEEVPQGYTDKLSGNVADGFTITNTHTPEKTEVTVHKVWNDDDNHDGKRPTEITVNLLADGQKVDSKTVTATNDWSVTFDNLDKFAKGKEIDYTVTEEPVEDYDGVVEGYTITNTHENEKVKIDGVKEWKDNGDQDGIRPTSITVNLLADNDVVDSKQVSGEGNVWEFTFDNLDKYKNVDNKPHEIVYTIDEELPEGYTKVVEDYKITNTHDPATKEISGTKTWVDEDDRDGLRPKSITINLLADGEPAKYQDGTAVQPYIATADDNWTYKFENLPQYKGGKEITYSIGEDPVSGYETGYTVNGNVIDIKNTHEVEKIKISGTKTWEDEDDIEGFRPESITIKVMNGETEVDTTTVTEADGWNWSFEGLYKNENGKPIEYTIVEVQIDNYEEPVITPIEDYNYEVINTHIVERVSYSITKTWDDDDDRDGIRPESITVNLLANGEKVDSKVLSEGNWSCEFTNLPKNAKGKPITYSITEDVVEGYEATITDITDTTTTVTIVNKHDPERTEIKGKKIWEEDQNYLDRRPDMVTVNIYADKVYLDTIKVKKEDNWEYIVSNLYKYSKGVEIQYTIEEEPVEGYVTVYNDFDITNTFVDGEGCTDCNPPKTMIDVEANNYQNYNTIIFLIAGFGALIQKRRISGN